MHKIYVPVVILSTKGNQKLTKFLSKGFERSVYWNEYKTKNENKNSTNECWYILKANFVGVNRYLFPFIQIKMTVLRDLKIEDITYQKVWIITSSSMEKKFYNQLIYSDI